MNRYRDTGANIKDPFALTDLVDVGESGWVWTTTDNTPTKVVGQPFKPAAAQALGLLVEVPDTVQAKSLYSGEVFTRTRTETKYHDVKTGKPIDVGPVRAEPPVVPPVTLPDPPTKTPAKEKTP